METLGIVITSSPWYDLYLESECSDQCPGDKVWTRIENIMPLRHGAKRIVNSRMARHSYDQQLLYGPFGVCLPRACKEMFEIDANTESASHGHIIGLNALIQNVAAKPLSSVVELTEL